MTSGTEWQDYGTATALSTSDTLLVRRLSVTPPAAGTIQQTTLSLLASVLGSGAWTVLNPSGDTTGAADANAIQAAYTAGKKVIILNPTGTWYIACGTVRIAASNVYIYALGCYIKAVGAGDVFWMHDQNLYTTTTVYGGGIIGSPWIDGSSCTGSSRGVNLGDLFQATCEVRVSAFTAGTSIGVWFVNTYTFTEQLSGMVYAQGCSVGVQFDYQPASGYTAYATGSFARLSMRIYIDSQGVGDGVVVTNGVFIYDMPFFGIYGNFSYPPSGTTVHACLRITGGASATHTSIFDGNFSMGCELGGTPNAYVPYTIYFADNLYNFITDCTGTLDFGAANAFTPCNYPSQLVGFQGNFDGDAGLLPLYFGATSTVAAAFNSTPALVSGTALQLDATSDQMLYCNIKTTSTFALSIGPNSSASIPVVASASFTAPHLIGGIRIPASWYVKATFTSADVTWLAVGC